MISTSLLAVTATLLSAAASVDVTVKDSGGEDTSGREYGFLFEDINNSGDGGIYAELIVNRAFQYSEAYPLSLSGYRAINADLALQNLSTPLSDALPVSMNVAPASSSSEGEEVGFLNEGYWGMDVKQQTYTGSFWVKGQYDGVFNASLRSNLTDDVFGSVEFESKSVGDEWTEHAFELVPDKDAPNSNNTFAVTFDPAGAADGSLDFNLISLFPPTYKDRKNGLRIDLAETIEAFATRIRFPGGNMLEGLTNETWWNWKDTIGPLKDRPGFPGVWGYQQTNGLGLMEFLYWAEDMNLEPVVAVWAGLALNGDITPEDELQPFIDSALEEIEFITGPADSTWGSVRASLGRQDPWTIRYVEVGNEDWLAGGDAGWQAYKDYRLPLFQQAINAKYPDLVVIASGAKVNGLRESDLPAPGVLMDYHPYLTPDAMVDEFADEADLAYPHIVGEVAATHPNGGTGWAGGLMPFPWWIGSVGEAVALVAYERHAVDIPGVFYAPVLRNMNRWQWAITLVQFAADPALTTRSTSWHVWDLFASHPLTQTLATTSSSSFGPLYYVAGKNEDKGSFVWKGAVYNTTDGADVPVSVSFDDVNAGSRAAVTLLTNKADDPYAQNNPLDGNNVVQSTTFVMNADEDGAFKFTMPELSVAVLDTDWKAKCRNKKRKSKF